RGESLAHPAAAERARPGLGGERIRRRGEAATTTVGSRHAGGDAPGHRLVCNGPSPARSSWFSRGNGSSALRRGNLAPRPRAHGRRDGARAAWLLGEPPYAILEEADLERVASRPRHHRADRDLDRLARGEIA